MSELPGEYWQLNLSLLEEAANAHNCWGPVGLLYCKFLNELRIRTEFLATSETGLAILFRPFHTVPFREAAFTLLDNPENQQLCSRGSSFLLSAKI